MSLTLVSGQVSPLLLSDKEDPEDPWADKTAEISFSKTEVKQSSAADSSDEDDDDDNEPAPDKMEVDNDQDRE